MFGAAFDGSYVVVDFGSGEVLGQVGTIGSTHNATVEIGYGMNAAVRGRGIATAAVGAIVRLLTSNGLIDIVTARTSVTNPASGRVLEKNGFSVSGREKSDEGDLLVWTLAPTHHCVKQAGLSIDINPPGAPNPSAGSTVEPTRSITTSDGRRPA